MAEEIKVECSGNFYKDRSNFKKWLMNYLYDHKRISYASMWWKAIDFGVGTRGIKKIIDFLEDKKIVKQVDYSKPENERIIELITIDNKKDQSLQEFLKEQGLKE